MEEIEKVAAGPEGSPEEADFYLDCDREVQVKGEIHQWHLVNRSFNRST